MPGDANIDPANNIKLTITAIDQKKNDFVIAKTESLDALLKKIAANFNPNATRYDLTIKGGKEIDLDEDEITLDKLGLRNGSALVMTPRGSGPNIHSISGPDIHSILNKNLRRERSEKLDAVRAHWFAHRYIPKDLQPVERHRNSSQPLESRELEPRALEEFQYPDLTAETPLSNVDDINPLLFIIKAIDAKQLLEIPYDHIEKICPVGRGNYGTVYKANCQTPEYPVVAVKEYTDPNDMVHDVQVFIVLGKHRNLVNFHGVTKNPETLKYEIVQEFAENGNLHNFWDIKEAASLLWPTKINMACDLACGLKYIHQNQILHRGLDCENVLIRKDGSLALTGFSLSGLSSSTLNIARVKEQLTYHGNTQVDLEKGDIYSLGILLWEILHGKRAFEDNYDPSLLEEIMDGRRPGMNGEGAELMEGTPPDYIRLYEACWHADPSVWPTMSNIVARLETLKTLAKEDQRFNWEQLDSVWIGWENKQLTREEIGAELDQLNVDMVPYNHIFFQQKNFRRGGFADIHVGIWDQKKVAVKAQTKHQSDIIREVHFLKMMKDHPKIVEFYGIARDADAYHYIIMRLARFSLHEYIRCKEYISLPWSTKFNIALGIAEGLEYLHGKHIIHCDVHSGNVLIDYNGAPRLTDFGLSRTFEEAQKSEFRIKIYGRIGYLAPELLKKPPPPYNYAHDIFGFGVLCWEIASSDNPGHPTKVVNPARFKTVPLCPNTKYQDLYQQCGSFKSEDRPELKEIIEKLHKLITIQGLDVITGPNDCTPQVTEKMPGSGMPESVLQNMEALISFSEF